jgi:NADPH:quinone reductase-like Zn-dependent oxidoreductase
VPRAVQFDSYGGVDVLEVRDVPRPVPEAGEVLVEVKAAGINPSEAVIRSGALADQFPATFPSGQGSDLAGVVAELGSGVNGFAVGDGVIGFSVRRSSHAEYVTFLRASGYSARSRAGPGSRPTRFPMRRISSIAPDIN